MAFIGTIQQILQKENVLFESLPFLHISLTKTLHLLQTEIKPMNEAIRKAITSSQIRLPIVLLLKKIILIDNFVAVELHEATCAKLRPVVKEVEKLTKSDFYSNPIFHISLFRVRSTMEQSTADSLTSVALGQQRSFSLTHCSMKAGSAIHSIV